MSMRSSTSTRRELLKRCGALGLASLGGCACPWPSLPMGEVPALRPGVLSPPPPCKGSLPLPVAIDAHCHIFNVEDVPASPMLKGPIANELASRFARELICALADVVSAIAYGLAPSAREELAMLEALSARYDELTLARSPHATAAAIAEPLARQLDRFSRAFAIAARDPRFAEPYRAQLRSYNEKLPPGVARRPSSIDDELSEDRIRDRLSPTRDLYPAAFDEFDPFNLVRFAYALTSPRFLNLVAMQCAYAGGRDIPAVGIFCPSTLDLEGWLGCRATATSQNDQMRLLEEIALLSGGTVLPIVGYNPRSDVEQDGASFARVVEAICNRGFVGVKLYPPMGYLAYGNVHPDRPGTCPRIDDAQAIDARLGRLYSWCRDYSVPIMSHTSHSFGSTDAHDDCATPWGWQQALDSFDGLRVQAGHFGGDSEIAIVNKWASWYVQMMGTSKGQHLYADVSNLGELFVDGSAVRTAIEPLIKARLSATSAEIGADRLLYGSDWYMTQLSSVCYGYAGKMSNYLGQIEVGAGIPKLRERVFGRNAVELYGLAPSTAQGESTNRKRLERYYATRKLPRPAWLEAIRP